MSFVHGKDTYISVNAVNLSAYCNTSEFNREADTHDVTTYGKNSHVFKGGLTGSTVTIGGIYDSVSGGPGATLRPIIGDTVTLIRRTEGTGTGKPQESVSVVVKNYKETNPVADMIAWSAEFQCSDDITDTTQ